LNFHIAPALLTLSLASIPAFAENGFTLSPIFGEGMVLQISAHTIISGTAKPTETINVTYKPLHGPTKNAKSTFAHANHEWRTELDLTDPKLSLIGSLVVKSRHGTTLTLNVVLGDVWLMGCWQGQGVPLEAGALPIDTLSLERFADLTVTPSSGSAAWQTTFSRLPNFSSLHARTARLLSDGRRTYIRLASGGYVGVVGIDDRFLESALLPGAQPEAVNAETWEAMTQSVRLAHDRQTQLLIQAKRRGEVITVEPIVDYDPPVIFKAAALNPNDPELPFSFKGAIWPRAAARPSP
jgi:hypothetical protein